MTVIHDNQIAYKRRRLYIPAKHFMADTGDAVLTSATLTAAVGPAFGYDVFGSTTPVEGLIRIPPHWNPMHHLGFRVHFCPTHGDTQTAADTANWVVLAEVKAADVAFEATADDALDTVIALGTAIGIDNANTWTARGKKNKNWATIAQIEDGAMLQFSVACPAHEVDTNGALHLLGLEIDYVPMNTVYPHNDQFLDIALNDPVRS